MGFDAATGSNIEMTVGLISSLVSSVALFFGAFYIKQQLMQLETDNLELRKPCPRCQGTGYEPCMCTRWSDNDVGCSGCNNTGYTRCRSCGGSGSGVPIALTIRKNDDDRSY